jgi:hypothetical protein
MPVARVVASVERPVRLGQTSGPWPTIDYMTTPDEPDAVARLAAIRATAGSAGGIFEPGYLEALRQDWPD